MSAIGIELTEAQLEQLETLDTEVRQMHAAGEPGALVAQVVPNHEQMYVILLDAEQAGRLVELFAAFEREEDPRAAEVQVGQLGVK